jgi:hypothetical protein
MRVRTSTGIFTALPANMRRKLLSTSSLRRGDPEDYLPLLVIIAQGDKIDLHRNLKISRDD